MHEIVLSIVVIVTFVGVLGYLLFSEPKSKAKKLSPLFNADVTWGGPTAEEVFETFEKSNMKVTFKGEHKAE